MVAGDTRKAEPIAAASKPRIVWRISGARIAGSSAGCAQANMSASRSSGRLLRLAAAASSSSARRRRWGAASSALRRRRVASIHLRRATVESQASGLAGTPFAGQSASAAAKASESASSAAATSRVRAASSATSLP
jgi:hypothetical protein